jgi:hypothetical protein
MATCAEDREQVSHLWSTERSLLVFHSKKRCNSPSCLSFRPSPPPDFLLFDRPPWDLQWNPTFSVLLPPSSNLPKIEEAALSGSSR